MSFIRSADAALYYEEYGAGETVILLPGLSGTIELDWRRFIPDVARHFHTIAVDLRGHGKTNNPSGTLLPEQLLSDLGILFATLEIDQAILCAHGWMSFLPLLYALNSPEHVRGIILHAPSGVLPRSQVAADRADLTPVGGQANDAQGRGSGEWRDLLRTIPTLFSLPGPGDALRSIPVPVLITAGARDVYDEAQELARHLPDCRISLLPQSGQIINSVRKSEFLQAIVSYAEQLPGSG